MNCKHTWWKPDTSFQCRLGFAALLAIEAVKHSALFWMEHQHEPNKYIEVTTGSLEILQSCSGKSNCSRLAVWCCSAVWLVGSKLLPWSEEGGLPHPISTAVWLLTVYLYWFRFYSMMPWYSISKSRQTASWTADFWVWAVDAECEWNFPELNISLDHLVTHICSPSVKVHRATCLCIQGTSSWHKGSCYQGVQRAYSFVYSFTSILYKYSLNLYIRIEYCLQSMSREEARRNSFIE